VHDLVITGGRVVDPASGTDAPLDLAVDGGSITALGPGPTGRTVLDASGCLVLPGFVDLHSHAQSLDGQRMQALDGVTTALDLEAGAYGVARAYADAAAEGRHLHHGFSASWASVRMQVLAGVVPDGRVETLVGQLGNAAFQREATRREEDALVAGIEAELAEGGLGVGVIVGYSPGCHPREYVRVAALAAAANVPAFTHARDLVDFTPDTRIDGAEEIVRAAAETGAHMHYCHVNSTSLHAVDRVHALVAAARREGSVVTTEAYPYGAGMTGIGAAFLAPDRLAERGLAPASIVVAATGERVAGAARLTELRAHDPTALVVVHFLDEDVPADADVLRRALLFEDTCVASDAMPLSWNGPAQPGAWPLPPEALNHPRSAGTFARAYDLLVRRGPLGVAEFVRRAAVLPAQVVADATGGAVRKGSLATGADADVVVLDPATYRDRATYDASNLPSTGVRHLVVAGTPVVRDGAVLLDSRPGRAVRR
jgi:cytosine/adenosine deaminase-related metal-dependent hydrolase